MDTLLLVSGICLILALFLGVLFMAILTAFDPEEVPERPRVPPSDGPGACP